MLTIEELEQVERYIIGKLPLITLEKLEKSHQETRQELAEFRNEARQELAEFRDETRQKLAEFRDETRQELAEFRDETRQELAEFRDETRQKLAEFRDEAHQELAEFKQETHQRFEEVDRRFAEAKADRDDIRADMNRRFAEAKADRDDIRADMSRQFAEAKADRDDIRADLSRLTVKVDKIDQDVGQLKGMTLENNIFNKAPAIFGRYLSRGRNVTDHVLDLLHEAQEKGLVSEAEYTHVAAADMLWGGKLRPTKAEVVLVIEVSWKVAMHDVIRARDRATTLQKVAITALPVVMGKTWDEAALQAEGVVRVVDEAVDSSSWAAITNV